MGTLTPSLQEITPLEAITKQVASVPVLPQVVSRLLAIIGGHDHSLHDMVKIVETDASLAARVLRVANSAAFFRGQTVDTLSKAILNLGEKLVAGIAIGSCTTKLFNHPLDGYESEAGDLWDHSLRTAIAARETASFASKKISTDLAFTAGLLHDIGKAIISEFLNGYTEEITNQCDIGQVEDFVAAEKGLVGTDHAEVGFALARHWNLPDPICTSIKNHHYPKRADEENQELVYVVHIGDILAMLGGTGTGADTLAYKMDEGYERYFKLEKDDVLQLLLFVEEEFSRTKTAVFAKQGV